MKLVQTSLAGFFLLLGLFSSLIAASANGATVNSLGTDRYSPNAAGTQNMVAGSIYHFDLTAQSSTNYWAGVYGNVSGSVQLLNSAGKDLITWNVGNGVPQENPAQNVYTGILAFNQNTAPKFDTFVLMPGSQLDSNLGLSAKLTDSADNLFTFNSATFIIGNKTINGGFGNQAFCPVTYNASSGLKTLNDCNYMTMVGNDSNNNIGFATSARPITWTGDKSVKMYDNASFANYELLLFSNNSGTSAATTYYFYLELR